MNRPNVQGMQIAAGLQAQREAEERKGFVIGTKIDLTKAIYTELAAEEARHGLAAIHRFRKEGNSEAVENVEFNFAEALNVAKAAASVFMVGMGLQKPPQPKPEEAPAETNGEAKSSIIVTG